LDVKAELCKSPVGFVGFTEEEVRLRCAGTDIPFEEIKTWYDGYDLSPVGSVYNPYSVIKKERLHR
jgi:hypothetical protein